MTRAVHDACAGMFDDVEYEAISDEVAGSTDNFRVHYTLTAKS